MPRERSVPDFATPSQARLFRTIISGRATEQINSPRLTAADLVSPQATQRASISIQPTQGDCFSPQNDDGPLAVSARSSRKLKKSRSKKSHTPTRLVITAVEKVTSPPDPASPEDFQISPSESDEFKNLTAPLHAVSRETDVTRSQSIEALSPTSDHDPGCSSHKTTLVTCVSSPMADAVSPKSVTPSSRSSHKSTQKTQTSPMAEALSSTRKGAARRSSRKSSTVTCPSSPMTDAPSPTTHAPAVRSVRKSADISCPSPHSDPESPTGAAFPVHVAHKSTDVTMSPPPDARLSFENVGTNLHRADKMTNVTGLSSPINYPLTFAAETPASSTRSLTAISSSCDYTTAPTSTSSCTKFIAKGSPIKLCVSSDFTDDDSSQDSYSSIPTAKLPDDMSKTSVHQARSHDSNAASHPYGFPSTLVYPRSEEDLKEPDREPEPEESGAPVFKASESALPISPVPTTARRAQTARAVIVMRHGERIDDCFGEWYKKASSKSKNAQKRGAGGYKPYDLNMPATLKNLDRPLLEYQDDTALTVMGGIMAQKIGRALYMMGRTPEIVYCSPALRCVQTGGYALKISRQPFILRIEPGLFENTDLYPDHKPKFLTPLQLQKAGYDVDTEYTPYMRVEDLFREPETNREYNERVQGAIDYIVNRTCGGNGTVLIVAHASTVDLAYGSLHKKFRREPRKTGQLNLWHIAERVPYVGNVVFMRKDDDDPWHYMKNAIPPITYLNFSNRINNLYVERKSHVRKPEKEGLSKRQLKSRPLTETQLRYIKPAKS